MKTLVKTRTIIIKVMILAVIAVIYNAFVQTVSPIIANQLAMQQMQNYDTSSMGIQLYQYIANYGWIVFVILFVIMFHKDVVNIIKKIKENVNNEEE